MRQTLTIPELLLIVSTRVALGAGVALLIAGHLNKDQRQGAGWALVGVGALTTVPLAMQMHKRREEPGRLAA